MGHLRPDERAVLAEDAGSDVPAGVVQGRRDQPYFLTLSYGPPHFPLDSAPPKCQAMYRDRDLELRPNVPEDKREQAEADLRGYYAHIAAIDECFGDLIRAVDHGGGNDTIVVFTSDHGDMMWSQGLEYKLSPWEESIRVPLLVRHRGTLAPRRSPALFNSPDLMPTLLGLAGLPIPDSVQGADLSRNPAPSTAFLSVPAAFSSLRWTGFSEYRGVRDGRYTYVRSAQGPWLLYDNVADPYQMDNRCGDPALADVRTRMEAELDRWLDHLGDDFLPGDVHLRRDGLDHYFEVNEPLGYTNSPWKDWTSTIPRGRLWSVDTPIDLLITVPEAREIIARTCPALLEPPTLSRFAGDSPRVVSMLHPSILEPARLSTIDVLLTSLPPRDAGPVDQVAVGRGSAAHSRRPEWFDAGSVPASP
ncbi:sulfatase-like hydrolase/transferase [Nonomuraea insulae]|uniref:Sulfatase-like hydrolase/transferase n=1 Tax=Nonomuraea insulae TaxID=1616787 RepID=A0ABW1CG53_9ACTN